MNIEIGFKLNHLDAQKKMQIELMQILQSKTMKMNKNFKNRAQYECNQYQIYWKAVYFNIEALSNF